MKYIDEYRLTKEKDKTPHGNREEMRTTISTHVQELTITRQ